LLGGDHDRIIGDISDDGRMVVFVLSVAQGSDIWTANLEGSASSRQYLANGFQLAHPALSPDGRWLAYDSDETGRIEVYVQSFPDPTVAKRQVSSGGGTEPLWTRGGRELVFRRGDSVMAASMEPSTGSTGTPALLFAGPYVSESDWADPRSYDVTPDGERFLLLRFPAGGVRRRVLVTTNWFPELKELVAAGARP
jgi:serine/threonine-protein kinase